MARAGRSSCGPRRRGSWCWIFSQLISSTAARSMSLPSSSTAPAGSGSLRQQRQLGQHRDSEPVDQANLHDALSSQVRASSRVSGVIQASASPQPSQTGKRPSAASASRLRPARCDLPSPERRGSPYQRGYPSPRPRLPKPRRSGIRAWVSRGPERRRDLRPGRRRYRPPRLPAAPVRSVGRASWRGLSHTGQARICGID
jgi:hypothetical protein